MCGVNFSGWLKNSWRKIELLLKLIKASMKKKIILTDDSFTEYNAESTGFNFYLTTYKK